jgi:branched-chain amino acid transport system ATP-binding protein/branched-chain amino acid transport system permease protein
MRTEGQGGSVRDYRWRWWIVTGLLCVGGVLFAASAASSYARSVVIITVIMIILTQGVAITFRGSGDLSFAHPGIFGVSGYVFALWGSNDPFGNLRGLVLALIVSAILGLITFELVRTLRGFAFSIATLAISQSLALVALNWTSLTGGSQGILSVPRMGGWVGQYILSIGLMLAVFVALTLIYRGRFGRRGVAAASNPPLAGAMGIDVRSARRAWFVIGAIVSGFAGVMLVAYTGLVTPDIFAIHYTVDSLLILMVGGAISPIGPLIGGVIAIAGSEALRFAGEIRLVIFGTLLLVLVIMGSKGLGEWLEDRFIWKIPAILKQRRRTGRDAPTALSTESRPDAAAGPILELDGITKSYKGIHALVDVSCTFEAGLIYGIVGPNGAGKTTLLNVMTGASRSDKGRLRLKGRDVTGWAAHRLSHAGLARTFQSSQLFEDHSVIENVLLATSGERHAPDDESVRAAEIASTAGVDASKFSSDVSALDLRSRKQVEVALASAHGAACIALDEPFAGLQGHAERQGMVDTITAMRHPDRAVIVVDHNIDLLFGLVDHVYVLDAGRLIASGQPDEVMNSELVRTVYLGPDHDSPNREKE